MDEGFKRTLKMEKDVDAFYKSKNDNSIVRDRKQEKTDRKSKHLIE